MACANAEILHPQLERITRTLNKGALAKMLKRPSKTGDPKADAAVKARLTSLYDEWAAT